MIDSFTGRWSNLSNFGQGKVYMPDGILYPRREHAFQAQKTLDLTLRQQIADLAEPAAAKRFGQTVPLRPNYEQIKTTLMHEMLHCAFNQNDLLRHLLASTGKEELVEGNRHHDIFWGVCHCVKHRGHGQNHLGILLMAVRVEPRAPARGGSS